jgi:hypothetical protein
VYRYDFYLQVRPLPFPHVYAELTRIAGAQRPAGHRPVYALHRHLRRKQAACRHAPAGHAHRELLVRARHQGRQVRAPSPPRLARADHSRSLIPPAYYADLACERGRLYLNELLNLGDEGTTGGTATSRDEEVRRNADRAKLMWGAGVHKDVAETMFYI